MDRSYHLSDVVGARFLAVPWALFVNDKYINLSSDAKLTYALLLNRLSLSKKNGWLNENNEVYLIYKREELANILGLSYKKTISAFKELIKVKLLKEERRGCGMPNMLFPLKAELSDAQAKAYEKDDSGGNDGGNGCESHCENDEKKPSKPHKQQICRNGISRTAETAYQELPKRHIKNCRNGISRTAEMAYQELPKWHIITNSYIDFSYIDFNYINLSINKAKNKPKNININSETLKREKTVSDEEAALERIVNNCELYVFNEDVQTTITACIKNLYYSKEIKVNSRIYGRAEIRRLLEKLNFTVIQELTERIYEQSVDIINPMKYLAVSIINELCIRGAQNFMDVSIPDSPPTGSTLYAPFENFNNGAAFM